MTGLIETVLDVLWFIWILFWVGAPIYEAARERTKRVVRRGRGTFLSYLLLFAAFGVLQISFTGPWAFLSVSFWPSPPEVKLAGLGFALVGLAFSVWARLYLGSNWSPSPMLKKDQVLVRTGPYSIVRNPIYLGMTVAMIGTGMVFGGYRVLLSVACMLLFSWVRIREEERLLDSQFGDAFARYKKAVRAFLPGII